MIEKIVNGKMEKFYEENCLLEQHFIKDEGMTMKELVDQAIAKIGENMPSVAFRDSRWARQTALTSGRTWYPNEPTWTGAGFGGLEPFARTHRKILVLPR